MSTLPQLVNTPIELKIGEVKLQVKRAGVYDLAELQEFIESNATGSLAHDERVLLKAIYLCAIKVYPEITEDYINEMIPATLFLEHPEMINELMVKLGFMLPPKPKAKTVKEEPLENK
jgi:hypothetical protein